MAAGQLEQGARVATDAERVADGIPNRQEQAQALIGVVQALVMAGELGEATRVAHSMPESKEQARAFAVVIRALVAAGQREVAAQLTADAEQVDSRDRRPADAGRGACRGGADP